MSDTTPAITAPPTTEAAPATTGKETPPPYSALRAVLGIGPKVDPEKPKEDTKPEVKTKTEAPPKVEKKAQDEKPAEVEKEAPAETEKPVKRVPKAPQVVRVEGADELKKATASLRDAADDMRKAAQPKAPESVSLELPEEIDVDELKALEELEPKKFKGLEEKARKFWGKGGQEDQYIADWKKANPGQQFDSEAAEHAEFYDKNEPFVTDHERKAAQRHIGAKIATSKAEEAARKVTEPVQRQIARERAVKAAEPQQSQWEQDLIKSAVETADPESKGIDVSKLADEHPLLHGVVTQLHETVKPALAELFALKNGAPYDAQNPVHTTLMAVAEQLEGQILQQPEADRELPILGAGGKVVGYKTFLPMRQFHGLSKVKQAEHWTVNEDTILSAIQNDVRSATVANFRAEAEKIAKYGGSVKRKTPAKAAPAKGDKEAEETSEHESESHSVEASASAPTPTPKSESDANAGKQHPHLRKVLGIV